SKTNQLAGAFFLETGSDPADFSARRNDETEHALAQAPADAGEIKHARARLEVNGIDAVRGHQLSRVLDAALAFPIGYRLDSVRHRPQITDGHRNVRLLSEAGRRHESRCHRSSRGLQKAPSINAHI